MQGVGDSLGQKPVLWSIRTETGPMLTIKCLYVLFFFIQTWTGAYHVLVIRALV